MKKFFLLVFMIGLLAVGCAPPGKVVTKNPVKTELIRAVDQQGTAQVIMVAQEESLPAPDTPAKGLFDFLKANVAELTFAFLAFLKVIINLTPTEKDNQIFAIFDKIIGWIVPNLRAGGGKFT